MKIYVISLQSRLDRREFMRGQLSKYNYEIFYAVDGSKCNYDTLNADCYFHWVDPLLNRNLTPGEIGCALSHYYVWRLIAKSNEPAIILEDDSLLLKDIDFNTIESTLLDKDMLYLDYREMQPSMREDIDETIHRPYYPYCNNAYAITPSFAKQLVESNFSKNIFPVDELFPLLNGVDYDKFCLNENASIKEQFKYLKSLFSDIKPKIAALNEPIFKQISRDIYGSDIEVESKLSVRHFTVGTDTAKTQRLLDSANYHNQTIVNLGEGITWEGGDMSSPGGGHKLNLLKEYIKNDHYNDFDIILFVDGYDVVINSDIATIVERFIGFNCDVLFAGEKTCWPDKSLEKHFTADTAYKYLNSGCYIGYRWAILKMIGKGPSNREDDQLYLQQRYIEFKDKPHSLTAKIDTENYIFQCISGASEFVKVLPNKQFINTETMTCPCILHGNGGPADKDTFDQLYRQVFTSSDPYKDLTPVVSELHHIGNDFLVSNFLTPEQCQRIITMAEEKGNWKSLEYDKFPAYEQRIKLIDENLFKILEKSLMEKIVPMAEKFWWPLLVHGIRDMFVIKYSQDTQTSLNCHHDASLISGLVKLNDGYEGGDTYFHRQNYSNKDIPVGDLLIWPGQVTHGHEGRKVTSGTKYNLVIWTSRYNGDING